MPGESPSIPHWRSVAQEQSDEEECRPDKAQVHHPVQAKEKGLEMTSTMNGAHNLSIAIDLGRFIVVHSLHHPERQHARWFATGYVSDGSVVIVNHGSCECEKIRSVCTMLHFPPDSSQSRRHVESTEAASIQAAARVYDILCSIVGFATAQLFEGAAIGRHSSLVR